MLFPLDSVYERAGIVPPEAQAIEPDDIPMPYRSLLVHSNAMTPTLERHFGGRVVLRPLMTFHDEQWFVRRVLLVREETGQPVEMGAIRIELSAFEEQIGRAHV